MKHVIGVIGLGYVGLPLAIEFGKKQRVIGFDINAHRVDELMRGEDRTLEADLEGMHLATKLHSVNQELGLTFSSRPEDLRQCNTYIVTVPTPIDKHNNPDLNPLLKASEMLSQYIGKGDRKSVV